MAPGSGLNLTKQGSQELSSVERQSSLELQSRTDYNSGNPSFFYGNQGSVGEE